MLTFADVYECLPVLTQNVASRVAGRRDARVFYGGRSKSARASLPKSDRILCQCWDNRRESIRSIVRRTRLPFSGMYSGVMKEGRAGRDQDGSFS